MVNDIFAAIADGLVAEKSNVPVYDSTIRQNLNVPCFMVDLVDINTQRRLNKRYALHLTFSVTYLGEGPDDTRSTAELLPVLLASIKHNSHKWEGGNISVKVDDQENTVTALVQYFAILKQQEVRTLMMTLKQSGGIK